MARRIYRNGKWHVVEPGLKPVGQSSAPMIIQDQMPEIKSMADGKRYDSKSAYRKSLKNNGYIECGDAYQSDFNGTPKAPDTSTLDADIRRAMNEHGT